MAENEPTMTVDDATEDPATAPDGDSNTDMSAHAGYPFDEQTLGQSSSVFDAGVEFVPASVPPLAPPPGGYQETPAEFEPERQAEMSYAERRHRVRLEARRVRRVIRHIELWSVLKLSLVFYLCLWLILIIAGLVLWSFAESSGTLESIEELVESLFALDESGDFWGGGTIFKAYAVMTLALCIGGITFTVLLAGLYNLISDLLGGIRITVIEEESARFVPPKRRARR